MSLTLDRMIRYERDGKASRSDETIIKTQDSDIQAQARVASAMN